jgi:putative membrane protein
VTRLARFHATDMFRSFLLALVVLAVAFAITEKLLSGLTISGGVFAYLWIALLFGVVNAILGTVIRIITFPLTVLTLGVFSIIVNALLLDITAGLTSHLTIDHFWWTAIWGALILSVVTLCLDLIVQSFMGEQSPPHRV